VVAKLDQVRLDGEPDDASGFPLAANVVNALYEFTKREVSLSAMRLHGLKYRLGRHGAAMGCSPHEYLAGAGCFEGDHHETVKKPDHPKLKGVLVPSV